MSKSAYFPRGNAHHKTDHEPIATSEWSDKEGILKHFALGGSVQNPFIFGKLESESGESQLLAYNDDAGIVTIAGSRAGKGVSLIIPNLLNYQGGVIVTDPKGENAKASAQWRQQYLGQDISVFDPFGITQFESASFNPLLCFDPKHDEFIDDITDLAEALIVRGNGNDPHWDESARSVIKMILIYIVLDHDQDDKNLIWLRTLILKGQSKSERRDYEPKKFFYDESLSEEENAQIEQEIAEELIQDQHASFVMLLKNLSHHDNDYVSGTAQRLLQAGDRERGSIISTVQRNTEFLDSKTIQRVLKGNNFDLSKLWNSTIYLVLPEMRMTGQSRFLRLMLTMMLRHVQMFPKPNKEDPSLLLVLDECATLGYMPIIEQAAGYLSGFGVKLWTIWQDLSQLKAIYDKRWETFIGNASIFTAFGNVDFTTQDYISKRLGQCETSRVELSYTNGTSSSENKAGLGQAATSLLSQVDAGGSSGENATHNVKPSSVMSRLLHPEEVGRYFGKNTRKVFVHFGQGQPLCVDRIVYYDDEPFVGRAGENNVPKK